MSEYKVPPRMTPDRDSKYMGLAWMHAAFSKDPSTQVGAVIVSKNNKILGSGYNGPFQSVDDNSFSWERPPEDDPDAFSKYDVVVHAEVNAMDCCAPKKLQKSTLYVIALPCPHCMKEIGRKKIGRVVYGEFQSTKSSMLQNAKWRNKSFKIAELGKIQLEKFAGNINWVLDWTTTMSQLNAFNVLKTESLN